MITHQTFSLNEITPQKVSPWKQLAPPRQFSPDAYYEWTENFAWAKSAIIKESFHQKLFFKAVT